MAGKYSQIIHKLPRLLGTEPAHQAKVDAVKAEMIRDPEFQKSATALARQYANLRALRDPVKEFASLLQVKIDAIEQMMTEQYEAEGTTSLNLTTQMLSDATITATLDEFRSLLEKSILTRPATENVRVQYEPYAQVVDKEAFRVWCVENGHERSMTLPWATTNSLVKEILLNGEPEPPGVSAKAITKTFLTKR